MDRGLLPGGTFLIYLGHLTKSCNLSGFDSTWETEMIMSIAKGVKNKPTGGNRIHNSLGPAILDRIIRYESWGSELSRLCYVTYLFMLRLPSEALTFTRAIATDRLLTTDKSSAPSLVGLREFHGGQQRLIIKLDTRKNTKDAFISTRPCFCGQNALRPRHNFPIHRFWEAVMANTEP